MVIELWAVEAFVLRLLLLLVLRKQSLCAFLSLIFLCGMMPCNICQVIFFVVGVLPTLEMQVQVPYFLFSWRTCFFKSKVTEK
jgi:hypothetical protein